jgi:tRNA(Ile)-lysidine synthetase-like protein
MDHLIIFTYIILYIIVAAYFLFYKTNKDFQHLLEKPNNYYFGKENIQAIDVNNPLVKTIHTFCQKNNIYENGAIISLSGGVDSMVVLVILIKLSTLYNFQIYACSINYNLRKEQSDEIKFLELYCKKYGIKCYFREVKGYSRKKEDSGSRNEFEEESRKIRFHLYKEIINTFNCTGVFVGHHKDDIIENIFTNSMKGANLLDLEVMKETSTIHSVNIYRPLLEYHKDIIYDIAHKYNIPYFLDTTPKWSRRGKMRNEIFPLFDNIFSKSWRVKLKDLGEQSNKWGEYIKEYIITPWYNEIIFGKYGFIIPFKNQPKLIYSNVLVLAMHKIGKHMLKSVTIDKILENKTNVNKIIILDSGFIMFIDSSNPDKFLIFHKDSIQNEINNINFDFDKKNINEDIFYNFINGNINYKKPIMQNINKKIYDEMNCNLPIELIKIFKF